MSYEAFLKMSAGHDKAEEAFIAKVLADALLGDELGEDELARALRHAARHVSLVLGMAGIELVFDEKGDYKWLVT